MKQNYSIILTVLLLGCTHIYCEDNLQGVSTTAPDIEAETTTTEVPKIPCEGKGKVCLTDVKLCEKGFVDGNKLERSHNYTTLCNATDVCCTIRSYDPKNYGDCAIRNINTFPLGPNPVNANFGEFPWQAMILRESTKTLLCGGIIIKKNFVLTTGDCVAGHKTIDILTKGGEWKLGVDEEPKDFQLVRLKSISLHPDFNFTKVSHNLAILHLERDYKFDEHIQPLCLDSNDSPPKPGDSCVTTGWGQEALKVHKKDAIENYAELEIQTVDECNKSIGTRNFNPNVALCAKSTVDACLLDFGSALACQSAKGSQKYLLKGVYSNHSGCKNKNSGLVFTKPDYDWINAVTTSKKN